MPAKKNNPQKSGRGSGRTTESSRLRAKTGMRPRYKKVAGHMAVKTNLSIRGKIID